jgi:hypothetical protein
MCINGTENMIYVIHIGMDSIHSSERCEIVTTWLSEGEGGGGGYVIQTSPWHITQGYHIYIK